MSSKSAHTPRPWHIGMNPGPMVYGPHGEQVADLRGDLLPDDEAAGNRALILAAPDLLAALRFCADALEAEAGKLYAAHLAEARAAIAKAEAGSHV